MAVATHLSPARLVVTTQKGAPVSTVRHAEYVRAVRATPDPNGLLIALDTSWGSAVLAVVLAWNIPLTQAVRALEQCRAASGRMEMFGGDGRAPLAIVDYAHTPDALAKSLSAARLHCRGQ